MNANVIGVNQTTLINDFCNSLNVGIELSTEGLENLKGLIKRYSGVFKFGNQLSCTNLGEVDVKLRPHARPVRMKPYKVVGEAYEFLKNKFKELEDNGLIE